jgi:hypothetical protein
LAFCQRRPDTFPNAKLFLPVVKWSRLRSGSLCARRRVRGGLADLICLLFGRAVLGVSSQSIVAALRSGGLQSRLPVAVGAVTAAVRRASLGHIGPSRIPGRPRTPEGIAAESQSSIRMTRLKLVGDSLAAACYQAHDWLLADSGIDSLTMLPAADGIVASQITSIPLRLLDPSQAILPRSSACLAHATDRYAALGDARWIPIPAGGGGQPPIIRPPRRIPGPAQDK